MAETAPKSYTSDPTLYLYTSLTAGSSHIITATSRLETILKANKIPFRAIDCATDERARMLWGRRSKGKKIPGLVKFGTVIGDLDQIEEWNEYGELKDQVNSVQDFDSLLASETSAVTSTSQTSSSSRPDPPSRVSSDRHISISEPSRGEPSSNPASSLKKDDTPLAMAMRQAGAEAAAKAGNLKSSSTPRATPTSAPTQDQPPPTSSPTSTQTTPSITTSTDAETPDNVTPETTAAKTPSQLAAEGKSKTITDKITSSPTTSPPSAPSGSSPLSQTQTQSSTDASGLMSNEQQMLDVRRSSSLTKEPSRLAETTHVDDAHTMPTSTDEDAGGDAREDIEMKEHGGAQLIEPGKEDVEKVERNCAIPEESVTEVEDDSGVAAEDAMEEGVTGGKRTQDMDAKDGEATGVSVGE